MKAMPTDDDAFGKGSIRADGRGEFPSLSATGQEPGRQDRERGTCTKLMGISPSRKCCIRLLDKCHFPTAQPVLLW